MKSVLFYSALGGTLAIVSRWGRLRSKLILLFLVALSFALLIDFSWLSFTYLSALILILVAEKRLPRHPLQREQNETGTLTAYILIKRIGGPLALMALMWMDLHAWSASWGLSASGYPIWLQSIVALLALDLKQYWLHRGQHSFSLWWKFHRVHHLSREISAIAHGRTHLLEFVFVQVLSNFLLAKLLGLHPTAVLYGYLYPGLLIAAIWAHANLNVPRNRMPLWAYVFSSPNAHAIHHMQTSDRTNFGEILVLWDVIFGTFTSPAKHKGEWSGFGVIGADSPANLWYEQLFATQEDEKKSVELPQVGI